MDSTLLREFYEKQVYKLGEFTLKSGIKSSIYIDLRVLISTPELLSETCKELVKVIKEGELQYDYIVGVPYAALPIATLVASELKAPMLLKRKEAKAYGTKKLIEGIYEPGKRALIIEDVVTSGASILETVESLRAEGLICEDVVCALDREQGGISKLEKNGIKLHSAVSMTKILDFLVTNDIISDEKKSDIREELIAGAALINSMSNGKPEVNRSPKKWKLSERQSSLEENTLNKLILKYMLEKKTNLCVAVDETEKDKVLEIIHHVSSHVCAIKLHADIIEDFDQAFIDELKSLSRNCRFVLFADRKLADTGNTVELQLTKGNLKIAEWANVVTVHAIPGKSILDSVGNVIAQGNALNGALLIASLSSKGALTDEEYSKKAVSMAKESKQVVSGFICQKRCSDEPGFLYWTPGVNESNSTDGCGQQWRSIHDAIERDGNDIIVVGRAITKAENVADSAKDYAQRAFNAWESR